MFSASNEATKSQLHVETMAWSSFALASTSVKIRGVDVPHRGVHSDHLVDQIAYS